MGQFRFGPGFLELKDMYLLELHRAGATAQVILGYFDAADADKVHQDGAKLMQQIYPTPDATVSLTSADSSGEKAKAPPKVVSQVDTHKMDNTLLSHRGSSSATHSLRTFLEKEVSEDSFTPQKNIALSNDICQDVIWWGSVSHLDYNSITM